MDTPEFELSPEALRNAHIEHFHDDLTEVAFKAFAPRYEFARARAEEIVTMMQEDSDAMPPDAVTSMTAGMKKFIFATTADDNFEDTPSKLAIGEFLSSLMVMADQPEMPIEEFSSRFNAVANLMVTTRTVMENQGKMLDVPIHEQIWHIIAGIDQMYESSTSRGQRIRDFGRYLLRQCAALLPRRRKNT